MITYIKTEPAISCFYMVGILFFVISFLFPATPQKMTSHIGKEVEIWESTSYKHIEIASEPVVRILRYVFNKKHPDDLTGDAYAFEQAENIKRVFYSMPASFAWWAIIISVIATIHPNKNKKHKDKKRSLQYLINISILCTLFAIPLLAIDFYRDATTYHGYFHLGLGPIMIILSYFFTGISLNWYFIKQGYFNIKDAEPINAGERKQPRRLI